MRILVTGGAGFIGSAFCRLAVARRMTILNLDKLTYASSPSALDLIKFNELYRFAQADIGDFDTTTGLISDFCPDAIVHMAAETHVDRSIDNASPFISTNIVGTFQLLNATLQYWQNLEHVKRSKFRFLHVSTDEVFGSLGSSGAFCETSRYDPRSPYAASKASSDHLVRAWGHTHGLPVVVTNCSNNFGPYQFPDKLIPLMIINALEGRALPIYGDGGNVRDWLYVDDHVRALFAILENGRTGETYTIGGRSELTNFDVVNAICDLVDRLAGHFAGRSRRAQIQFVEDRPGHDRRYAVDPSKLELETGWQPVESFESGLANTVAWYLSNQTWWRGILATRYDLGRLGRTEPKS